MNNIVKYDYKKLRPFKWFVLENFPFIEADFDAITNYQLFCKVVEYLNKTIDSMNQTGEVVEEFTQKFIDLQNYVNNYFDNLDVQDEINNKLDEMVQKGELQTIILNFLKLNSLLIFNNVNEMKQSQNLIEGSFAKTLGYYEPKDGGESFYIIKNNYNENDEYIKLNSNLYAILIPQNNTIFSKQFGCVGDGITNDFENLQRFFNYPSKNYIINNGNYYIDEDIILKNSNCNIKCINSLIKYAPNNKTHYYILKCYNLHDINFEKLHLVGDKNEHLGTEGQFGHCLHIIDSYNINVKNSILENAWGDGIYIGLDWDVAPKNTVNNIKVSNCKILNCSRNGISLTTGNNIVIENNYIYKTDRTNPRSGIDIEPSYNTDLALPYMKNLVVRNNRTEENYAGISLTNNSNMGNVIIENNVSYNDNYGFTQYLNSNSIINYINNSIYFCKTRGLQINSNDENSKVNLINTNIVDINKTDISETSAGIYLKCEDNNIYNINIINCNVKNGINKFGSAIYETSEKTDNKIFNLKIDNLITDNDILFSNDAIDYESFELDINKTYNVPVAQINLGLLSSRWANKIIFENLDRNTSGIIFHNLPNGEYKIYVLNKNNYKFNLDFTDNNINNLYNIDGTLNESKIIAFNNTNNIPIFVLLYVKNGNFYIKQLNGELN